MGYPRLPFLALPWTRFELPGWGRVMPLMKISVPPGSPLWKDAPTRVIRGKAHGFLMELHLHDWAERTTYFLGRYYELSTQLLLDAVLDRGDRVVDVGGNIGMIALLAAHAVGPGGSVETFEPNPECQARLRRVLDLNDIGWVKVIPYGLSDEEGKLELTIVHNHTGVGTFAPLPAEHQPVVSARMLLELKRGDDLLLSDSRPIKFLKIDVEGFETKAIRGLAKTIERDHPVVIVETIDRQLRQAGSSAEELFQSMLDKGYRAYSLHTPRRGLRRVLKLEPLATAGSQPSSSNDILWIHPSGPKVDRLRSAMLS